MKFKIVYPKITSKTKKYQQKHKKENNIHHKKDTFEIRKIQQFDRIKITKKRNFLQDSNGKSIVNENMNLIEQYGEDIFLNCKKIETSQKFDENFLFRKKDFFQIRTKMVDFMIEVFSAFQSHTQTLFHAVTLMDLFIYKNFEKLENSQMHLIGVTCIYISSKYEDLAAMKLPTIVQSIAHNTFSS